MILYKYLIQSLSFPPTSPSWIVANVSIYRFFSICSSFNSFNGAAVQSTFSFPPFLLQIPSDLTRPSQTRPSEEEIHIFNLQHFLRTFSGGRKKSLTILYTIFFLFLISLLWVFFLSAAFRNKIQSKEEGNSYLVWPNFSCIFLFIFFLFFLRFQNFLMLNTSVEFPFMDDSIAQKLLKLWLLQILL